MPQNVSTSVFTHYKVCYVMLNSLNNFPGQFMSHIAIFPS